MPWSLRDVGLAIIVVIVALVISTAILGAMYANRANSPSTLDILLVAALLSLLMLGLAWAFTIVKYGTGWKELGFVPVSGLRDFGLSAVAIIASLAFTGLYKITTEAIGIDALTLPEVPDVFVGKGLGFLGSVMVLAVLGPFAEEVFFRGFIYRTLRKKYAPFIAILLSSVIFAVLHGEPGLLIPISFTGIALAWLYERTGSIWPPLTAHVTQNLLALWVAI